MKPAVKKRWLAALRSGEYKQCIGQLHDGEGFCCLGVLEDIEDDTWWEMVASECWRPTGQQSIAFPPEKISKRSGLSIGCMVALADMNDECISFTEIADWIEKHL